MGSLQLVVSKTYKTGDATYNIKNNLPTPPPPLCKIGT